MKRYLARLAERATAIPQPAAPVAAAIADPFETVAPPLETAAPEIAPRVEAPPVERRPLRPPDPSPERQPLHQAPVETILPPQRETVVHERIVETVRTPAPVTPPRIDIEPPPLQPPPTPDPVIVRTEQHETVTTEERRIIEERAAAEQQLLRKADAFMGQLLDRRPPAPQTETETRIEQLAPVIERVEAAPRLQPPPTQQPVHEAPLPEPPSLVIGNLTVEVLPSAPTQAPQRQPVIIVRGGRGAGRPSFPSSRRFGMRQF